MPITFQNINPPSNVGLFRGLSAAGDSFNSGLDRFQKVIDSRESANQGVLDRADAEGVLRFKQLLGTARTPEDVGNLAPRLAEHLATLSSNAQSQVLGLPEDHVNNLQKANIAQGKYTATLANQAQNEARRPLENSLYEANITNQIANSNATGQDISYNESQRPIIQATNSANNQSALDDINISNEVAAFANSRANQARAERTELVDAARNAGINIPVSRGGAPDIAAMSPAEVEQLNIAVEAQRNPLGLNPNNTLGQLQQPRAVPTHTQNAFSGDSQAAFDFKQSLVDKGYSPAAVERSIASIDNASSTQSANKETGIDAALTTLESQTRQATIEREASRNRYSPNSRDALNAYEELMTEIPKLFGDFEKEDLPDVQNLLGNLSREGIRLDDGTFVTPSKTDILSAVNSTSERWNIFNSDRAKQIKQHLKKNLNSAHTTEEMRRASKTLQDTFRENIRNALGR